ncbi:sugar phosphate isomerase/epimerase [Exilibacterium tricleocarpae]|uniref:Sugar phosphate isomerase/epimerase n=1 Tax=Exilibacterium tricleocarpae TaxID=2591008 RepID=A0A545SP11_9GAMM|nr:sugar phosphate isomerase/epimerase family protein [Exilibacterium tricleocarpae]TQV66718.1 sugar phosphate isomerase/epimerase [Exilibacterium tricleocarpae]
MKRRQFIETVGTLSVAGTLLPAFAASAKVSGREPFFKISVAQWSLHRQIRSGKLKPLDFAAKVKRDFDIDAVEYVNQFFKDRAEDKNYLQAMKERAQDNGVKNLLIMVDAEGPLASTDVKERSRAVERHYKWVSAANYLGCHSLRVNLAGQSSVADWKLAAIEGLSRLSEFAKDHAVNIIVENHGGYSSNGQYLAHVIRQVAMKNCGTLPDFGNFGDYDRYQGMKDLMPFAKGVSAKSFDFDENGNETTIDFRRMLKIVRDNNYRGYIGIEYEGPDADEDKGVRATQALLTRLAGEGL